MPRKKKAEKASTQSIVLPIFTDRPKENPGLGFERIVAAGTQIIRDNTGGGKGFTIGIFGPWGSGKTSILREMSRRLEEDSGFVVVDFEAWRYGEGKLLMVELIRALTEELKKSGVLVSSPFRRLLNGGTTLAATIATPLLGFHGGQLGLAESVSQALVNAWNENEAEEGSSASDLLDIFRGIDRKLEAKGKHAVILVDDLDRCSPEGIAQILNTLNALMDFDHFVFVLALDRAYIVSAITDAFELKDDEGNRSVSFGDRFLEKIIQVPLNVPQVTFDDASLEAFLGAEKMPILESAYGLSEDIRTIIRERIIPEALRSNPRQVKRFFNGYVISNFINEQSLAEREAGEQDRLRRAMLYLIGLSTAAPTLFQRLSDDVSKRIQTSDSVDLGSVDELETFHSILETNGACREAWVTQLFQQNPLLETYIRHMCEEQMTVETISEAISLTATSSPDESDCSTSLSALFEKSGDLVEIADSFIRGMDSSSVITRDTKNARKYCAQDSTGKLRTFCYLTVTGRGKIHLLTMEANPALMVECERAREITGVTFRDVSNVGHWGGGNFDMIVASNPWALKNELPERIRELVNDSYERVRNL